MEKKSKLETGPELNSAETHFFLILYGYWRHHLSDSGNCCTVSEEVRVLFSHSSISIISLLAKSIQVLIDCKQDIKKRKDMVE